MCGIFNQIAEHCDEPDQSVCPICEFPMEEKFLAGGDHWLECTAPFCGEGIDLSEEV